MMLNWLCTYEAPIGTYSRLTYRKYHSVITAELIAPDPRKALQRLREDDPCWRQGELKAARPVMQAPTPWGKIKFGIV